MLASNNVCVRDVEGHIGTDAINSAVWQTSASLINLWDNEGSRIIRNGNVAIDGDLSVLNNNKIYANKFYTNGNSLVVATEPYGMYIYSDGLNISSESDVVVEMDTTLFFATGFPSDGNFQMTLGDVDEENNHTIIYIDDGAKKIKQSVQILK